MRFLWRPWWRSSWRGPAGAAVLAVLGALLIVRWDIAQRREAFQADARVAHRLLSQRVVRLDAVLATLSVLPLDAPALNAIALQLLPLYPELRAVRLREAGQVWPEAALAAAEVRARRSGQAELAGFDTARGQLTLVQAAGARRAVALQVDVAQLLPWAEWPIARGGPVQLSLLHEGHTTLLQPGGAPAERPLGWTPGFVFSKAVAGSAQAITLQLQRATGPAQWPWAALGLWLLAMAAATAGGATLRHNRRARERAEALLRLGQVARLNTLGELAAGLAHELNQPLTAVVANAQAARRLLDGAAADPQADLAAAREALGRVVAQGRRAADVVARLRRRLDGSGDAAGPRETLDLGQAVRSALDLLAPELRAQGVALTLSGPPLAVRAEPVALAQIIHNLVGNALHALAQVPSTERQLHMGWAPLSRTAAASAATVNAATVNADIDIDTDTDTDTDTDAQAVLIVRDTGPGFSAEALPRLFEPFYTTRADGLGLGLSLCESLAQAMDGALSAHAASPGGPRGAEFRLRLPLARASQ